MSIPKTGVKAPNFKLKATDGSQVSLADLKGNIVVLYFYPKDDTPGCTVEACQFRDSAKKFDKAKVIVLGVSPDGLAAHNKFIEKFKLPFLLLSDEEKEVCKAYGVWVQKSMYGRQYMGVARTTFLIGPDAKILKVYEKVKPDGHAEEVLGDIQSLRK